MLLMDGHGIGASGGNFLLSPMNSIASSQSDCDKIYIEEMLEEVTNDAKDSARNRKNGLSPKKPNMEPSTQPPMTKSPSIPLRKSTMQPRLQSQSSMSPKSQKKSMDVCSMLPKPRTKSMDASTMSPKSRKSINASTMSPKSRPKSMDASENVDTSVMKPSRQVSIPRKLNLLNGGGENSLEGGQNNPESGPYLLNQARELITSGGNPRRALLLAIGAVKSFEISRNGDHSLDLVMSLHVAASIHCTLGQYLEAIPLLEKSIKIPSLQGGFKHSLAKFSSYMELGDTFAMLGQLESSIHCYNMGLEVQEKALGSKDPRVGDSCRYLAEAHMQALQFDEAERLCMKALDIHRESGSADSLEETADRRLLGLIFDAKGDHEMALEHLVLASMLMVSNGQEADVALVDCSIGDSYVSLGQYDQAVSSYQKALTMFKSTNGEKHPSVASVFVRLANLYNKIGKFRESRCYCENALIIYGNPLPGRYSEEIVSGLTEISAIYESMEKPDQALKLLQKALNICYDNQLQQSMIAAIEAQMGALYYMTKDYLDSYWSLKHAIEKLRACLDKRSAFFGTVLNQMGLACVQCDVIDEAAKYFEEARSILEQEYGPYHPEALGVCSNLAGTYDAMGRLDESIEILDHMIRVREEKIGTTNQDVYDEKRRLSVLLKETGRERDVKITSLQELLGMKFSFYEGNVVAIMNAPISKDGRKDNIYPVFECV